MASLIHSAPATTDGRPRRTKPSRPSRSSQSHLSPPSSHVFLPAPSTSTSSSRRPTPTPSPSRPSLTDRSSSHARPRSSSTYSSSSASDGDVDQLPHDARRRTPRRARHKRPSPARADDTWLSRVPRAAPWASSAASSPIRSKYDWDDDADADDDDEEDREHDSHNEDTIRISGASTLSYPQLETPPATPTDNASFALSFHIPPVVVAAPIPGVETMDALVDGMNGGGDDFMPGLRSLSRPSKSSKSSSSSSKLDYHPLYQPPLPTPPPGVVLGGGMARKSSRASAVADNEDGAQSSSRRNRRNPPPTRTSSTATLTPHITSPPTRVAFPSSDISADMIAQAPAVVPSISEIIRKHAPPSAMRTHGAKPSLSRQPSIVSSSRGHATLHEVSEPETPMVSDTDFVSRSSVDSIAAEVRHNLKVAPVPSSLHHARSFPDTHTSPFDPLHTLITHDDGPESSFHSALTLPSAPAADLLPDVGIAPKSQTDIPTAIATYLRSARLTTLLRLTRTPHAAPNRPLTVSLSDLGSPTGHPLVVFLGLGCVRHLMGLYDEMADCLGLRLIAIDRWGLGRTETTTKSNRGIPEWSTVVEEVLDRLGIDKCSVMAHSAGSPYALSFANRFPDRVVGDICLLAPWVGGESTGYKWLKYVPNGLLKTAQAAEWKIQAWMIGKPPKLAFEGIGYSVKPSLTSSAVTFTSSSRPSVKRSKSQVRANSRVYLPSEGPQPPRPSTTSSGFSFDDLRDFEGRFGSQSTLGEMQSNGRPRAGTSSSPVTPQKVSKSFSSADAPQPKRKPSRGFLGRFTRQSSFTQSQAPQTPLQHQPEIDSSNGGRKLKGLRSIGSLKSKSTPTSATNTLARSPHLPDNLSFDGLGLDDIDWPESLTIASTTSGKTSKSENAPVAPQKTRPSRLNSSASLGPRAAGRRSISVPPSPASATSEAHSVPSFGTSVGTSISGATAESSDVPPGTGYQTALGNALLAASHAESARGTHSDLIQILNRDERPWGFSYQAYPHRVKVWYGDKDEKIAEDAVRWMERNMGKGRCEVKVVKGADHGLMYNSAVVVDVLDCVADFWKGA